jgi:hypothetical protein
LTGIQNKAGDEEKTLPLSINVDNSNISDNIKFKSQTLESLLEELGYFEIQSPFKYNRYENSGKPYAIRISETKNNVVRIFFGYYINLKSDELGQIKTDISEIVNNADSKLTVLSFEKPNQLWLAYTLGFQDPISIFTQIESLDKSIRIKLREFPSTSKEKMKYMLPGAVYSLYLAYATAQIAASSIEHA